MEGHSQNVLKCALLLFNTDGCTLATHTANLQVSEDEVIEIGQVRHFRHGKDIYLVEVLDMADTKQELNEFERDWQDSHRSNAIQSAKSDERVGNFLGIASPADSVDDIRRLEDRIERGDTTSAGIQNEVCRLRENQERILVNQKLLIANHSTIMETVLSIRELLSTKVKKVTPDIPSAPPVNVIQVECPGPPCPASASEDVSSAPACPATITTPELADIPDIMDFDIPDMLSIITTPTVHDTPLNSQSPCDLPIENETPPLSTINLNCARELNFSSPFHRPLLNIGSVRNPVNVDRVWLERAKKLPTVQRFILAAMDLVFSKDELSSSSVLGETTKYNGREITKKALCKHKRGAIFNQAALLYEKNIDQLQADVSIRNAMNSKVSF